MTNPITGGKYKFATVKENYEDYSSGRVLYGTPGATGFPVRLVSEVFQRAVARLKSQGVKPSYSIYDPFCGAGYLLASLGLLHGVEVKSIIASDINKEILVTANRNLSLLTASGFENRVKELNHLRDAYNKTSHKDALESAGRLENKIPNINAKIFEFNMLGNQSLPISNSSIDLVLTDLPYGKLTHWGGGEGGEPTQRFLNNISPILKPISIVAISVDKKQKIFHEDYERVEIMKIGKKQILFLTKKP